MSIPNKYKALHEFYNSFGIPAYEENSVPDTAKLPYIAYEAITSQFDSDNIALTCSVYYKSNSLTQINAFTEAFSEALRGGRKLLCDTGYIVLYRGEPFAQNRPTDDKTIKAKYLMLLADYITL